MVLKFARTHDIEKLIAELVRTTNFNDEEVRALHKRYEQMLSHESSKNGVHQEEFQRTFGLGPFEGNRLFKLFSRANDLSFAQLCRGLSSFSPNATTDEKMKASFNYFDSQGTGAIGFNDLREIFEQFCHDNAMYVRPVHIDAIVEHTLQGFGLGRDGSIDFTMYQDMVIHHPQLIAAMTISTWQLPL